MALPNNYNTTTNNTIRELIPFRHYGRQNCLERDFRSALVPDPPLCSPNLGTDGIVDYFHTNFNFTARESAAIMGAHTIGSARRNILGFAGENGWVPDNTIFDHQYYTELVGVNTEDPVEGAPQWRLNLVNNSNFMNGTLPDRFQWEGFPMGRKVMMLNSDIAMVRQLDDTNKDNVTGEVFCTFVSRGGGGGTGGTGGGGRGREREREQQIPPPRCPVARSDLFNPMVEYANDNELFLRDFRDAMIKMTDMGYRVAPDCNDDDDDTVCPLIPL